MNPINPSENTGLSNTHIRIDKPVVFSAKSQNTESTGSLSNSLPDLNKLAIHASQAGEDIRMEAVERAQKLIDDPNWLSDYNIDGLADKLLDIENIWPAYPLPRLCNPITK